MLLPLNPLQKSLKYVLGKLGMPQTGIEMVVKWGEKPFPCQESNPSHSAHTKPFGLPGYSYIYILVVLVSKVKSKSKAIPVTGLGDL
jgi:hypothetical protein